MNLTQEKKDLINKIIKIVSVLIAVFFPLACFFVIEYINFLSPLKFLHFLTERRQVVMLAVFLFYIIYACVILLFKYVGAGCLFMAAASVIIALVNYIKYALTGDYLYPWDILQVKSADELIGFVKLGVPPLYVLMCLCLIIGAAIVIYSKLKINLKGYVRIPIVLVIFCTMFFTVSTPAKVQKVLNKNSLYLEDAALQQSNYVQNGFVGASIVNILSTNIEVPADYSEKTVDNLLDSYEYIEASEDFNYPDIILILSESFWDPKNLTGTEFSDNPTKNYDEIITRDGVYYGKFYTTGFGGGTVRPEFEVLTGLSTDFLPSGSVPYQFVNNYIDTYVTEYKKLGYETLAIHPYTSSFYSRKDGYGNIGIDTLYFEDELMELEIPYTIKGRYISDDSFCDYITYYLDKAEEPTFLFGISMENHQPYTDKYDELDIKVTNPNIDETVMNDLSNYVQGVADADAALGKLVDYIDNRDRDTILIFYGDHLPTLGGNYGAYVETGMIKDTSNITKEERLEIYSTPFLIYSNFELKDSDMLTPKTTNHISSYNLLNAVSDLLGSPKSEYMQFLKDFYFKSNMYNARLNLEVDEETEYYINGQKIITYDRLKGKGYSLEKNK